MSECMVIFEDLEGIVIDDEGYSIVSEDSGSCLSIYDPQGKKIHTVLDLKRPSGTALDVRDGILCMLLTMVLKLC